jgi:hypothetical protein
MQTRDQLRACLLAGVHSHGQSGWWRLRPPSHGQQLELWFSMHMGTESSLVFQVQDVPSFENAAYKLMGDLVPGAPLRATAKQQVSMPEGTFSCWAASE